MEKLIYKYLSGTATKEEKRKIAEWTNESEKNMEIFVRFKNLYVATMMPHERAAESEADLFIEHIKSLEKCALKTESHSRETIGYKTADNKTIGNNTIDGKSINEPKDIKISETSNNSKRFRIYFFALSTIAAAAVITFVLTISSLRERSEKLNLELGFILSQQLSYHENSTPYGVKGRVILPDSSVVWLNSGSSIQYPSKFHGDMREITFEGEGYFEIRENGDFPMKILLSNGMSVYVKGTTFNLSSYKEDTSLSLLLLSGSVSMLDKNSLEFIDVRPNQKLFINKITNKYSLSRPEDIEPTVGWKSGWLVFDETPMPEILKKLERWYGVNIIIKDKSVHSKTLTAKFREESLSQVMELMHRISLVNYTIKDSTVWIENYRF
jgi:ferric-dicitrate binding protein FerR (iron transport regulator)